MGREISSVVIKPAMMGGMAIATDCTDWRMPMMAPWFSGPACEEMMAVRFGVLMPLNIATSGMRR